MNKLIFVLASCGYLAGVHFFQKKRKEEKFEIRKIQKNDFLNEVCKH